ncbi:MAG: YceD family protein [Dehalococcoidia bacterium]
MERADGQLVRTLVNVAQLLKEPIGCSRSYTLNAMIDEFVESPVTGNIKLIHTNRGILVRVALAVGVELQCSRCLSMFSYHLDFSAEEEFLPTIDVGTGLPLSLGEESDDFTVDSKNVLDLAELIRQYTLLNLPMKPLCSPDCSGVKEMKSYGAT